MRSPVRPSFAALAFLGALTAGVVGCSPSGDGDNGDGGGKETGLEEALAAVPDSAADVAILYVDAATTRDLVARDKKQFSGLWGYGIPELSGHAADPRKEWGFDESDVATSIVVGSYNARMTGEFDTAALTKALEKKGYGPSDVDGGTRFTKSGDDSTFQFSDSIRVSVHDKDGAGLGLDDPEKSLAGDRAYAAVADCLGDVYYASFYGEVEREGVVLLALGARLGADGTSTETICTVNASEKAARSTAAKLRGKAKDGETYAGSKVMIGGGQTPTVSMTWKNSSEGRLRPGDNNKTLDLPGLLLFGRG
ncbi:hypothetical protein EJ357_33650 [Streptomyces cyaneochromogenes]|uniref:Lipoprotein n=1 Tax=Streptomyces cyaneochromogenes TaxID=2496836 RepID=A0A3S9MF83_9ACTN|nr:hypothetical protein [Streptomyces cyaneochromogenes]AZQ37798.1 hypothetical protein EJ357_33650 [Streptomyces cyaneochromogenes]